MPSDDPSIFGLPCRFPAASSFSSEDRVQSHDSNRIFEAARVREKFFPEFPVAAGKGRGGATLPSSLWRRGRLRLGRRGSGFTIPVIALRAIPRPTARRRNWAGAAGG